MTWLSYITREIYKSMKQIEPLDKTDYFIVFGLLFRLNLLNGRHDLSGSVYHVQSVNIPCLDSIGFTTLI